MPRTVKILVCQQLHSSSERRGVQQCRKIEWRDYTFRQNHHTIGREYAPPWMHLHRERGLTSSGEGQSFYKIVPGSTSSLCCLFINYPILFTHLPSIS